MNDTSIYYDFANDFVLQTNRNLFLTGKAGTGKTTFLHHLKNQTNKQLAVVAPTGVAAINAGGVTLHSFFQLPLSPFLPTTEGKKDLFEKHKMRVHKRKILQELELLIIDEISMVRADTLDAVDTILRQVRYRHQEVFGGVQVVFIGDMFQLSPVVNEEEWLLLSQFYQSPYFFHSHATRQQPPVYIELDKVYRQSDEQFIQVLNQVRNNCLTDASFQLLQQRYNPLFTPPPEDNYITLTTHNYKADKINAEELSKLQGKSNHFKARIEGDFQEKNYPTEQNLHLKIGSKVMLIKNDTETPRRFYNGKIGIIEAFEKEGIIIQCPGDNDSLTITPMVWESIRYTVDPQTKQIEEHVIGRFIQYPLRLAWAITIHKSQGLTFEKVVIDAGKAFAPGQVYVALSRCSSLEGMVLLSKINPFSMQTDSKIKEFEKHKLSPENLEHEFNQSRHVFQAHLLQDLFHYTAVLSQFNRFVRSIEEVKSSFHEDTMPYLISIRQQLTDMQEVGQKFCKQLLAIFGQPMINDVYLNERMEAANEFFIAKINRLIETLKQSPASTDNKENARQFNEGIKDLYGFIAQRKHILTHFQSPYLPESFFEIKNSFSLPDFAINAYSKAKEGKSFNVRHPKLYFQLIDLRNQICEPDDTPIYLVASSKTIQEIANYLPLSEKELLQIHGFGKTKVEKYGALFLDIITEYCLENNLTSRIYEKSLEETGTKKKKKT